jgi:tripartite-type tricarboxylate transporter receptor subunit TctC
MVHLALPALTTPVKDGRLRAIAVTGQRRAPQHPDVQTLAEAGLTELRTDFIVGVVAPAATPKDIVDLLYRQIAATLKLPDIEDRLAKLSFAPVGSTPDEFAARIKADVETWGKIVRQANIKVE